MITDKPSSTLTTGNVGVNIVKMLGINKWYYVFEVTRNVSPQQGPDPPPVFLKIPKKISLDNNIFLTEYHKITAAYIYLLKTDFSKQTIGTPLANRKHMVAISKNPSRSATLIVILLLFLYEGWDS
ncbi:hypothetical protein NQ317_005993 [Molorchus minor]|uniref:Uncharacterized protein n=1 Tax=Molorchus minor TaxID=1323400 RepID=A0ABQ9J7D7_9CUCU|nr:hypothetical protein NQ317_005993 [Molorchus minor]